MSQTFIASTTLTTMNCGRCGGTYAISEKYRAERQRVGACWNCPYCKTSWGYEGTEEDRLRQKLEAEIVARLKAEEAKNKAEIQRDENAKELSRADQRLTASKRKYSKLKKRIEDGACPCCHERFPDLEKHIKAAHPGYGKKRRHTRQG